ncbi:MAG: type II secretion system protein [Candidatus Schekmanbacteria bacterium]|nr:type II secretion system protein [Candidatus Schekmanbacteria bacterium]
MDIGVQHKHKAAGFTLLELLVVVAIIAILMAIAVPRLIRSRMSANEATAVAGLRTIVGAQHDYNTNSALHTYANSLSALATGAGAGGIGFIDSVLGSGTKTGYIFTLVPGTPVGNQLWNYYVTAHPRGYLATGVHSFFINQSGVVLICDNGGVAISDPAVSCADGKPPSPAE